MISVIRQAVGCVSPGLIAAALAVASAIPAQAAPATIELPGARVFPESTTATADGTIYVGSLAMGGVMRIAKGGKAEPFVAPGAFDTRSIFGVLADDKSGTLWVCSNDATGFGVAGPSQVKGSFLKAFDLKTGEGKASIELPGAPALCNDIAIGSDGSAYVTNSLAPEILKLKPGAKDFEIWAKSPMFDPPAKGAGLDGIAFGADGALYVNTFSKGELFHVAVKDGAAGDITKLTTSKPTALTDALRPTAGGKSFLMIEGVGRLDRVTMSGDQAKIETLKDGLDTPTSVVEIDGTAWVTEGQLPYLFGQKKGSPTLPFDLRAVSLTP